MIAEININKFAGPKTNEIFPILLGIKIQSGKNPDLSQFLKVSSQSIICLSKELNIFENNG